MITANATITDVRIDQTKIWIELKVEGKYFPVHHQFDVSYMDAYSKIAFILDITNVKSINDLTGKFVRVIDTENSHNSLIAIGHPEKNRFIDLHKEDDFPVREWRIYWRYRRKV